MKNRPRIKTNITFHDSLVYTFVMVLCALGETAVLTFFLSLVSTLASTNIFSKGGIEIPLAMRRAVE